MPDPLSLKNQMVEIHLLNGKRFLGKVKRVDDIGITVYCIPLKVLETMPEGTNIREQLRSMLATLFFPFVNVEYIDVGGEPVGFDALFASWFGSEKVETFFNYEKMQGGLPTSGNRSNI